MNWILPNFSEDIGVSIPILVGFFPILIHGVDKLLEFVSPLTSETLRILLQRDTRKAVQTIGENKAIYQAVECYFEFRSRMHFVFTLYITSILSVYLGQVQCKNNFYDVHPAALAIIVAIFIQIMTLMYFLLNSKIDPAEVKAGIRWVYLAFLSFSIVLVADIVFHVVCAHSGGSHS